MSKVDDLIKKVRGATSAVWWRVTGRKSPVEPVTSSDVRDAYEESAAKVRAAFSREPEKVQSADTVDKVQEESGLRSIASSELHKLYQLSRRDKLENAANMSVFIVRTNGGIDILRGKANDVRS